MYTVYWFQSHKNRALKIPYADYTKDPYSEDNPMNTICSRGDLLKKPEGGGCYDTKVSETINSYCTCFNYCIINFILLTFECYYVLLLVCFII